MIRTNLSDFLPQISTQIASVHDVQNLVPAIIQALEVPGNLSKREYLQQVRFEMDMLMDMLISESTTVHDLVRDHLKATTTHLTH